MLSAIRSDPKSSFWRRILVGDAFAFGNRDPNYYRDKYLALFAGLTAILALGFLASGKLDRHSISRGMIWLGACVLSLALAKRAWVVLASALGFLAIRGVIVFFLSWQDLFLAFAIVAGSLMVLCIKHAAVRYPDLRPPKSYSLGELAIDVFFLILILYFIAGS